MTILEKYNRASGYFHDIRAAVTSLFSDYLQMPEGKLVSSKDKNKVLSWLQNLDNDQSETVAEINTTSMMSISRWVVESVDITKHSVTLFSLIDAEVWKENLVIEETLFNELLLIYQQQETGVVVDITDTENNIINISLL